MGKPSSYLPQLSTMSLNLAMSAFQRPKENDSDAYSSEYASKNVTDLLTDTGFSDFQIDYPDPGQTDTGYTIGSAIASKQLCTSDGKSTGKTLIAVAVRGANYTKEWASNVTIGTDGEAVGFADAATQVTARVQQYLADHPAGNNYAIWVVGYSRGGATANLTSQRLSDLYGTDKVFGYTFEAPMGGTMIQGTHKLGYINYTNIHNIINKADLVPDVAPACMGFVRYGIDHFIPGSNDASNNLLSYYKVGSDKYESQKQAALLQLNSINPEIVFDDSFRTAQMHYILSAIPYFNMASPVSLFDSLAENWYPKFIKYFLNHGVGTSAWTSSGFSTAQQFRDAYAKKTWTVAVKSVDQNGNTTGKAGVLKQAVILLLSSIKRSLSKKPCRL